MFWYMENITLELRFGNFTGLGVPFTQEQINRMLRQPIGDFLYDRRRNANTEITIGRVHDIKFKRIVGNDVIFDCICNIEQQYKDYTNPYVKMWED